LAQDFDEYLIRLNAFIERERAFTADVSHELRTPLAVVNGAAEVLLTDPKLPETSRHRVARMARAAEEMSEITAALLVLAREEGTQISRSVSCDVENVLQEVVDKLREPLQAKPIDMKLEIEAKPSLAVERAVLAMVIGNLLRNAFAYTDRGEIRVHLDSQSLTVTDTGIGIEAEKLPRVFERYFSSNNGSSNNGSSHNSRGTGIGLSLVKRICDRYGWSITIDSKQGHGTTTKLAF
jgi:signal transduction histidine kinase